MKKKKRGQSPRARLALFALGGLILLIAILVISLLVGTVTDSGFATEPWSNPFQVCTTQWRFVGEETNNPELMQALSLAGFTVTETHQSTSRCTLLGGGGTVGITHVVSTTYTAMLISLNVESNETVLADHEQIGLMLHDMLDAIGATTISQRWDETALLSINFLVDGDWQHSWTMSYQQAVRAYEADLTGLALFELGDFR